MIGYIATALGGFIVGGIVGIFFYRNNEVKIGAIADKLDEVVDAVEALKDK